MEKAKVIEFFGSIPQVADKLGITHQAVRAWSDTIPEKSAARLERITEGALKYDWTVYAHDSTPAL